MGFFSRYLIDGLTIKIVTRTRNHNNYEFFQVGRVLEGSIRYLNNLNEHLHQSYFFYLMISPFKFISLRNYLISLALLITGFLSYSFFSVTHANKQDLLHSVYYTTIIYLNCGLLFSLLLLLNPENPYETIITHGPAALVTTLVLYTTLIIRYPKVHTISSLETMKNCSFIITVIFLLCFSVVNFSFVTLCTIIICPIYTFLGQPRPQSILLAALQFIVIFLLNPICMASFIQSVTDWEKMAWDHWRYSTLIFPFVCLVYLPLNLTSMFISVVSHD